MNMAGNPEVLEVEAFPWQVIIGVLIPLFLAGLAHLEASSHLRRAERLTELVGKMSPSSERTLVSDLRDAYIVEWVLRQRMPTEAGSRNTAYAAFGSGVLALVLWITLALATIQNSGTVLLYVFSLSAMALGHLFQRRRQERQQVWMEQERSWRWIQGESRIRA